MNPEIIRADFPILHQRVHNHQLVYLDNAATSQKPRVVVEALVDYYQHSNSNVHRGIHELSNRATEAFEAARARVARFIGAASAQEIIFTRGTTESINLVATAWGNTFLKAGDEILITEMEHHSNLVPWQALAERAGARLRYVEVDRATGLLNFESLERELDRKPKLLALTHVSNTLGTINPVEEICRMARQVGSLTLVDAAQSVGHRPVNVEEIDCDFLAFSGHKMCAPTGIGVLYGRQELLDQMAPYQFGGNMISKVTYPRTLYKSAPERFEAGTPDIAGAIGLRVAIDYLEKIGLEAIRSHDSELAAYAYQRLSQIKGVCLLGPTGERAGVLSFELENIHAHDVVTVADQYGVALRGGHHCNQPLMNKLGMASSVRASFYLYNTRQEVDALVDTLLRIEKYFKA